MKKSLCLLLLLLCSFGVLFAQSLRGKTVYVTVKSIDLKNSTGFFARSNGKVAYGDSLTVLGEKSSWVEVSTTAAPVRRGWIKSANVSTRRVVAAASSTSASASELALAGKGFSEEVERSYRAGDDLNYGAVDEMEKLTVSEEELYNFLVDGHLVTGEE